MSPLRKPENLRMEFKVKAVKLWVSNSSGVCYGKRKGLVPLSPGSPHGCYRLCVLLLIRPATVEDVHPAECEVREVAADDRPRLDTDKHT